MHFFNKILHHTWRRTKNKKRTRRKIYKKAAVELPHSKAISGCPAVYINNLSS